MCEHLATIVLVLNRLQLVGYVRMVPDTFL